MKSQKSQIQPILEGTTQAQVVEAHQPAAEVVLSKSGPMPTADQVQKAVVQREREMHQYWASSVDYLIEEIRQAKKRLAESI